MLLLLTVKRLPVKLLPVDGFRVTWPGPSCVIRLPVAFCGVFATAFAEILPEDPRADRWNWEMVHKGQTEAGREFLAEALTKMGCPSRVKDILCVADLMDFDEGRIPGFTERPAKV